MGLRSTPFDDPEKSLALADGAVQRELGIRLANNKARKLGRHGFVDSYESAFRVFQEFPNSKTCAPDSSVNIGAATLTDQGNWGASARVQCQALPESSIDKK